MGSVRPQTRCADENCSREDPIGDYHKCFCCSGHLHSWCGAPYTENEIDSRRICPRCRPSNAAVTVAGASSTVTKEKLLIQHKLNLLSGIKKSSTGKQSRTRLDIATKLQVAEEFKNGMSQVHVMSKYNISRRLCSNIKAQEKELRERLACGNAESKSSKGGQFPDIERDLLLFLDTARKAGLSVTRQIFHFRALQLRDELLTKIEDKAEEVRLKAFSASESWVKKFIKRHNLKNFTPHAEAGSVDPTVVREGIIKLRNQLYDYEAPNIYNMNETALFYRLLPKKTYVFRGEDGKVRGVKGMKVKDRITLIVATNADGSHKLPLSIIGSEQKPCAFDLRPCPMPYFSQRKAWNDSQTCRKWFIRVFLSAIRKRTSKPVALVMDIASSHGAALVDPTGQVSLFFLPHNCTAVHQPMDCGIMAFIKLRYRILFLERTVELMDKREVLRTASKGMVDGTKGILNGHQPHMLDAAEIVHEVWEKCCSETVARCWLKASILPLSVQANLDNAVGKVQAQKPDDLSEMLVESILKLCLQASDISSCNPDTLNDVLDLSIVSKSQIEDWCGLEDNPEVQEIYHTEALEEVEAAIAGKSPLSDDNTEASDRTAQAEQGVTETAPISFSEVAKCIGKLEVSAQAMGRWDAAFHIRQGKKLLFDAFKTRKKQRQSRLDEYSAPSSRPKAL